MEQFDAVIKEFIDFLKKQVGVYIDSLAGFAGHRTETELQVHREQRPVKVRGGSDNIPKITYASYEDPTQPKIIHHRIVRTSDYLQANAEGGFNEQQQASAILIFIFTYWELEIRPRLAKARGVAVEDVKADILGDLRIVRNVILHAKGVLQKDKHQELKALQSLFKVDEPLALTFENMHQIFKLLQQDCARLMFDWLGVKDGPIKPEEIVSFDIQNARPRK